MTVASIDDFACVVVSTAGAADQRELAAGVIAQGSMVEPGLACLVAQATGGGGHFFTSHMLSKRVSLLSASACRCQPTPNFRTPNL
jgi:hypothetical protein